jgi:hypothetical protein
MIVITHRGIGGRREAIEVRMADVWSRFSFDRGK